MLMSACRSIREAVWMPAFSQINEPNSLRRTCSGLLPLTPRARSQPVSASNKVRIASVIVPAHRFRWPIAFDHKVASGACVITSKDAHQFRVDSDNAIANFTLCSEVLRRLDFNLVAVPPATAPFKQIDFAPAQSSHATE